MGDDLAQSVSVDVDVRNYGERVVAEVRTRDSRAGELMLVLCGRFIR
jgi:hypothetical protein